jgi:hypothetical protein
LKKEEHSSDLEGKLQDKKERNKDRQKKGYLAVVRTLEESSTYFKKKTRC